MMNAEYYKNYEPVFGNWRIKRLIGEGSYGKVFEIEREDFGTTYKAALKAITIPQNESEIKSVMADGMDENSVKSYYKNFVEDVIKEFVLMSKLKGNSNIVSYEDHVVIEHENKIGWDILIRMELLTPLIDYIKTINLRRKDVIQLGIDMCKALELCQKYNIIHRDIKPENIFVSVNKDFKLGDFGIARTLEQSSGMLSKKGTQAYMAPEIYKEESYRSNVDIYSLGIVMYRLLNENRTPFLPAYPTPITYNDRETAIKKRISGEPLPPPNHADGRLAEIVLKACQFNPDERYQNPSDMRKDLEAILNNQEEEIEVYAAVKDTHGKNSDFVDPSSHSLVAEQEQAANFEDSEQTEILIDNSNDFYNENIDDETEILFENKEEFVPSSQNEVKAEPAPAIKIPSKTSHTDKKEKENKKTKSKKGIIIAATIALVLLISASALKFFIGNKYSEISSIIIESPSEITIMAGEDFQLLPDMEPDEKTNNGITYQIEDSQIVTVDETGLIKALSEGTTVVEIAYDTLTKPVYITVESEIDREYLKEQFVYAQTFLNNVATDETINHDNITLEFDALSNLISNYDISTIDNADATQLTEYLNAYNNDIKYAVFNLETAYNKAVEIAKDETASNNNNNSSSSKTPPSSKKTTKKCPVCGSTAHTTHPQQKIPTCPTCGSTEHTVHPAQTQPASCPTCGSKYHTVHPESDVPSIPQDF